MEKIIETNRQAEKKTQEMDNMYERKEEIDISNWGVNVLKTKDCKYIVYWSIIFCKRYTRMELLLKQIKE